MSRTCLTCRAEFEGVTADYYPEHRNITKKIAWGPTPLKPRPYLWRDNVTGKYS